MAGHKFARAAVLAAALAVLGSPPAWAANYTWIAAGGGSFQTITNWSPNSPAGGPGAADFAIYGTPTGSYTVTFAGSVTNSGLQGSQGTPTLALTSGQTYTVSGTNGFSLGTTAAQTCNLRITGGTLSLTSGNSNPLGGGI